MINDILSDLKTRMKKSVDALKVELAKLRANRAHPSLLEHIKVDYYGSSCPLNQLSSITIENSQMLLVTPWEKSMMGAIEKAIMTSDLRLNPSSKGNVLYVPLPALTEERRKELVKIVHTEAEASKVSVRHLRREANHEFKKLIKDKLISEDDERDAQAHVQKLTDQFIQQIHLIMEEKEKDLMAL